MRGSRANDSERTLLEVWTPKGPYPPSSVSGALLDRPTARVLIGSKVHYGLLTALDGRDERLGLCAHFGLDHRLRLREVILTIGKFVLRVATCELALAVRCPHTGRQRLVSIHSTLRTAPHGEPTHEFGTDRTLRDLVILTLTGTFLTRPRAIVGLTLRAFIGRNFDAFPTGSSALGFAGDTRSFYKTLWLLVLRARVRTFTEALLADTVRATKIAVAFRAIG